MCEHCDHEELLNQAGLRPTKRRLAVMRQLALAGAPLRAKEVWKSARRDEPMDRVTAYRILEALDEAGLVMHLIAGDGALRYHLAACPERPAHHHFYCKSCHQLTCLEPGVLDVDLSQVKESLPAQVDGLIICLEGICPACMEQK